MYLIMTTLHSTVTKPNWCGGNYTGSGLIAANTTDTLQGLGCYYRLIVPPPQVVRLTFTDMLGLADDGDMEVNNILALAC